MVAGTCGDKQTSGCEDHKCAHMYRRVGGMMLDVHVAILSKPLAHLRKPPARPACSDFSDVCARRRTASAQQL